MSQIQRYQSTKRLSRLVVHNDIVYVAGVTAGDTTADIAGQTRDVLAKIDGYLASVGADKEKLLSVQIWLKDIARDFDGMNAAWEEWIPEHAVPTRATCEAKLARPELLVEIIVTAAL
ncbi:RidA family protein [Cupriavidus basilensis]|uniref:RidA family protein n=1 Tax=Cupriavidus TaxID=106589 RepID=UPI00044F2C5B|nr:MULTISPECIES: RidA family protein [Cupriavidus]KDP89524.1 cytochrome C2 [Cupriavidus sp. SK-3]MDF3884544.1 RidA family protein [Cupriavidus basilensis]